MIHINQLVANVGPFGQRLKALKALPSDIRWYPYHSLSNVGLLAQLLTDDHGLLFDGPAVPSILDIGAADGDMAFLFESLGCSVDIMENPPTNFNHCEGIKALTKALNSKVALVIDDVDFHFTLPRDYDLALALGILYHLRNPFSFLIGLALRCDRMILSTRIASTIGELAVKDKPLAYLLESRESNSDPTNYWIFSEQGLVRLLRRAGWIVLNKISVGCLEGSNPVDMDKDERMFVYCKRVPNYADLLKHHDF